MARDDGDDWVEVDSGRGGFGGKIKYVCIMYIG